MISDVTAAIGHPGDVAAVFVTVAAIAHWLPAIAALCSIIWFGIRIYEYFRHGRIIDE